MKTPPPRSASFLVTKGATRNDYCLIDADERFRKDDERFNLTGWLVGEQRSFAENLNRDTSNGSLKYRLDPSPEPKPDDK